MDGRKLKHTIWHGLFIAHALLFAVSWINFFSDALYSVDHFDGGRAMVVMLVWMPVFLFHFALYFYSVFRPNDAAAEREGYLDAMSQRFEDNYAPSVGKMTTMKLPKCLCRENASGMVIETIMETYRKSPPIIPLSSDQRSARTKLGVLRAAASLRWFHFHAFGGQLFL